MRTDGSHQPVLWCHRDSGHSYKVALALALLGVNCEKRAVDLNLPREQREAGFRDASKFGEVPALVIDGHAIVQSNAILDFLARRFARLDGIDMHAQTHVREWLSWESNRLAMSFPHLRYSRCFMRADPVLEAWWSERMHADFARLDQALADRAFLLGGVPTIADVSCCGYLFYTDQAGVDMAPWPSITAWLDRIRALPGWRAPYDLLPEGVPLDTGA